MATLVALQREVEKLRHIEDVVLRHRAVIDNVAANAILADYRALEIDLPPVDSAIERLRDDARWRDRFLAEGSVAEDTFALARTFDVERQVRDLGLSRTFANVFGQQQRVFNAAEEFFTPSLSSVLAAVARDAAAIRTQTLPSEWRSITATIRQALAVAPNVADYEGIRRAFNLQTTTSAAAVLAKQLATHSAQEAIRRLQEQAERHGWTEVDKEVVHRTAEQVAAVALDAIGHIPAGELATAVDSDENLFALVARLWGEVTERLPGIVRSTKANFSVIVAVVTLVVTTSFEVYHVREDRQDAAARAAERAVDVAREQERDRALKQLGGELKDALSAARWQTNAEVILRAEPDASSPPPLRLARGIELMERGRLDRWIAVEIANPTAGSPRTGWVYQRHLTLIARSNSRDATPVGGTLARP